MEQHYRRVASLLASEDGAALQFAGRRLALWHGVSWTPAGLQVHIPAELMRSWHPALIGRPWPATADLADVSPVSGRDRLRAHLRLTGTLLREQSVCEPSPWTMRVETCHWRDSADADRTTVDLEIGRLARMRPDPLSTDEAELIMHLHDAHVSVVERLSRLVSVDQLQGAVRVTVWRMESHGITLRIERARGRCSHAFLEWPQVGNSAEVSASLAALLVQAPTCLRTWVV